MMGFSMRSLVVASLLHPRLVLLAAGENATAATNANGTAIACFGDTSSGNCPPCETLEDCRPYYSEPDFKKVTCGIGLKIARNGTVAGCNWQVPHSSPSTLRLC